MREQVLQRNPGGNTSPPAVQGFPRNAENVAARTCRVLEHRWVNARYKYLKLEAAVDVCAMTRPGQFYQLRCPVTDVSQPFLLRPMSVYRTGPGAHEIAFLYNVTGVGTRALAALRAGDAMQIVGPLGNTFTLGADFRRILLVVRGVGLATLAPLVRQAAQADVRIVVVMSARAPADLMRTEFLQGCPAEVHCVYDSDGSSDVARVQVLVRGLLAAAPADAVYTCGSQRLLLLLQRVLRDFPEVMGQVAMEQHMACGMGVCLSCVRLFDVGGVKQFLRVCRDGPVFPIREVVGEVKYG